MTGKLGMEYASLDSVYLCLNPDKAKPSVRRGRKAADLVTERWPSCRRMDLLVAWLFLFCKDSCEVGR